MTSEEILDELEDLHYEACIQQQHMFRDPTSGLYIMTAYYLSDVQEKCCRNGCKYCPYGEQKSRKKNANSLSKTTNKIEYESENMGAKIMANNI